MTKTASFGSTYVTMYASNIKKTLISTFSHDSFFLHALEIWRAIKIFYVSAVLGHVYFFELAETN